MMTNKLEKDVILYKNQFEKLNLDLFGEHKLDRTSLDIDALLFRIKYMVKNNKDLSKLPELKEEFINKALELRNIFGEFMYEFLAQIIGIPKEFKLDDIKDILAQDVKIDTIYVKFKMILISDNVEYLEYVNTKISEDKPYNMFPEEFFRYYTDSYNDGVAKAYPELFENRQQDKIGVGADADVFCHNFTFQTSENCSLSCLYCLSAGTKILMADMTERNIEDIQIGDIVIGKKEFQSNENMEFYNLHSYFPTKVTKTFKRRSETTSIVSDIAGSEGDEQLRITKDHPILTTDGTYKGIQEIKDAEDSMIFFYPEYDHISNLDSYEYHLEDHKEEEDVYNIETECHTYIANNIVVHNCYQFNKSNMRMSFDTAKKFIDNLLSNKYGYINQYNSPAIILEFIGGEPLMEINLTRKIYEYFLNQCYELNHPWFTLHRVSICSNGLQYFDEEVQSFFKDYASNISFNISIDGNKELHDSCRIQPNGEGSYDIDMMALDHYTRNYAPERNSKMTLAPENIKYLFESVVDFIDKGMKCINLNCIFEEGWTQETALIEYNQLKKLADYILDKDLENLYIAIFNERQEDMQDKHSDGNFCFKEGTPVLSDHGNVSIENIHVGDLLYTASGSMHKVTNMTSYLSDDNKILKASGAFPIECTSDHKFFAKKFLYKGYQDIFHYSDPGFYPISELKKGDKIALPILDLSKNKENWIDLPTAYAIGIFLGDGWLDWKSKNVNITPGYDKEKFFYNALKRANLTFTEHENRTSMRYTIHQNTSPINERFFKVCLSCGHLAHNKHFPKIIFESTPEIIRETIKGYQETDGWTVPVERKEGGLVKINSVSKYLLNDLMILLRALGEFPTCYLNPRGGTTMFIEGREVNVKDRYEVYYNPLSRKIPKMFKLDPDLSLMWATVRSIEDSDEPYMVYCPTVMPLDDKSPEEHTIIVSGVGVVQCGGTGSMLALRPNGQFYPCIRYMPTSVGDNVKDLCIGNIDIGIVGREQESDILKMMDKITRRSSSNDICYDCPLGNDCANCSALGHTIFGTPGKNVTFICIQMIAEALANVYYWNLLNIKHPEYQLGVRKNNVPREWSLLVISEEELELLDMIESYSMIITMENS